MKTITYNLLVNLGACDQQLAIYKSLFGEEPVEVTQKNIEYGLRNGIKTSSLNWFSETFFSKEANHEFQRLSLDAYCVFRDARRYIWANYGLIYEPIKGHIPEYDDADQKIWLVYYHRLAEIFACLFKEFEIPAREEREE